MKIFYHSDIGEGLFYSKNPLPEDIINQLQRILDLLGLETEGFYRNNNGCQKARIYYFNEDQYLRFWCPEEDWEKFVVFAGITGIDFVEKI